MKKSKFLLFTLTIAFMFLIFNQFACAVDHREGVEERNDLLMSADVRAVNARLNEWMQTVGVFDANGDPHIIARYEVQQAVARLLENQESMKELDTDHMVNLEESRENRWNMTESAARSIYQTAEEQIKRNRKMLEEHRNEISNRLNNPIPPSPLVGVIQGIQADMATYQHLNNGNPHPIRQVYRLLWEVLAENP